MDLLDVELKGGMREDFSKALLGAFPKQQDLARFVKSAFDWELEQITEGTLEFRVMTLLEKAEAEGIVRRLIRRAEWANPNNPKLRTFLQDWKLVLPFSVPRLKLLHDLFRASALPISVLQEVVDGDILPEDWLMLSEEFQVIELLQALASRPHAGGRAHPLLEFVARLGHRPEAAALNPQLRDWLLKAGLSQAQAESLWRSIESEVPGKPLYLLVKIDLQGTDEYMVKAWLSDERSDDCEVVFGGDGKSYPLSGLDTQVQEILGAVRKRCRKRLLEARNELTLEFFLPRKLLCRRLDSILIESGANERVPLGIKYGVVVRSAERLSDQPDSDARFSWELRWKSFRENPSTLQPILIRTEEEATRRDLIARMAEQKDFFLALRMAPPSNPRSQEEDLLTRLVLRTGMPIAIWLQEGAPMEDAMWIEFESLLKKIPDITRQVRATRKEGFEKGERHLGNHLSLLWDDPERLPLEFGQDAQLEAPDAQG